MAMVGARNRGRGGPGRLTWVALGGAALVILGLTFALGMLVGRQWARQTPPTVAAEPARKAVAVRRSGLSEARAGRAAEPQEKLTFYQTLTAPLGAGPMSGRAEVAPKPQPAVKPRANSAAGPERGQASLPPRADEPALPSRAAAGAEGPVTPVEPKDGEERHEASSEWTVQVGVFKSSQQAERVRRALADGGFQAQVTPMTADGGQIRYRVRVGVFKTKGEALRTAERVRSDRSLPTFVTAK